MNFSCDWQKNESDDWHLEQQKHVCWLQIQQFPGISSWIRAILYVTFKYFSKSSGLFLIIFFLKKPQTNPKSVFYMDRESNNMFELKQ